MATFEERLQNLTIGVMGMSDVEELRVNKAFLTRALEDMQNLFDYRSIGTVEELSELVKAKQDGRLAVLPCKVGDTVWYLDRYESLPPKAVSGTVDGYLWFRSCGFALNVVWSEPIMGHFGYSRKEMPFTQIGKTVFLTCEEAEAVLKEGNDE